MPAKEGDVAIAIEAIARRVRVCRPPPHGVVLRVMLRCWATCISLSDQNVEWKVTRVCSYAFDIQVLLCSIARSDMETCIVYIALRSSSSGRA